jgi:hypothetical protein
MARGTKTKTISLEPEIQRKGMKQAQIRGFRNSFSAYVAKLILDDAEVLHREASSNGKAVPA